MSAELAAPTKSIPQAGVGKSPIPLRRTLGWGVSTLHLFALENTQEVEQAFPKHAKKSEYVNLGVQQTLPDILLQEGKEMQKGCPIV